MSDVMLLGVLTMPPELWSDSELDVAQRHGRYLQAAQRIRDDEATIYRLRSLLERARPHINAWDGDSESMHDDPAVIASATLAGNKQIADDNIDRAARISAACQAALRALDTYAAMYRPHMTAQLYSARAGLRDALGVTQ